MSQAQANGIAIEYDMSGPEDGPPVLLVMGFATQMIGWPDEFRAGLVAEGCRVIRFDNRDVGLSQKFGKGIPDIRAAQAHIARGEPSGLPYSLSDMAADAAGLLGALGIESAHVLGASMGGMIAQLMAIEHPAKVRSLISVYSTSGDPSLPRAKPEAMKALTGKPTSGSRQDVIAATLESRRAYASTGFPFDDVGVMRLAGAAYDRCYDPEGPFRQWAAVGTAAPRTERLKRLRLPTLVLHGSADPLVPAACGRHVAACIPGAEYVEIEGWGHDMPVEVIPVLHARIVPFIRKVELARRISGSTGS